MPRVELTDSEIEAVKKAIDSQIDSLKRRPRRDQTAMDARLEVADLDRAFMKLRDAK